MLRSLGGISLLEHGIQDLGDGPHRPGPVPQGPPVPVSDLGMQDGLAESVESHAHCALHSGVFGVPFDPQGTSSSIQAARLGELFNQALIVLLFHCGKWHRNDIALLGRDSDLAPHQALAVAHRYRIEDLAERGLVKGGEEIPDPGVRCKGFVAEKEEQATEI